jgi:GDSL-like Lipase/Acylhydrolase family
MAEEIVLLGDSIFDNTTYTRGEPDVVTHLRSMLPGDWRATLLAVDGSTTKDITGQISRVSPEASHLVVSIGGNDALANIDLIVPPADGAQKALMLLPARVEDFERSYRAALAATLELGLPTTVCTIYNGQFSENTATIRMAVAAYNDVILRVAFEHGLAVIELRHVCRNPEDYANPIEPSGRGGRKIAKAIAGAVGAIKPSKSSTVWSG